MMWRWLALVLVAGCGLNERSDFLVGRSCDPTRSEACDPGQVCLPHRIEGDRFRDFRCRDQTSFESIQLEDGGAREAPLAYCSPELGYICPGDLVCNADRVRLDGGARPLVCKSVDDLFAPPIDGGV